ncbi:uncharacterized protein F5Z01DRAFT_687814 [Emericellopsis atlantica]|uniref:Histidine-specific methyltransferase SAM-dependent domain-containing protein n=1 Tax=Emericellopsis atlantica TaxID=2614577 RepID=A0A9P7ZM27_9HYPO|nr:uncharacterized protein F5Z01DRAFT_687814 [Emericellopsis atlantica]KAG9254192.1 hypothetical protein F5Z01DRAFT_687814 [Emericellopsis atlantica]
MHFHDIFDGCKPDAHGIITIGQGQTPHEAAAQLPEAFRDKADFPHEIMHTTGMVSFHGLGDASCQAKDEIEIINKTAFDVVKRFPSGTAIVHLGAINSTLYAPYVEAFKTQKKSCVYLPLVSDLASLNTQVTRATETFPGMPNYGLYGTFEDGDDFFANIKVPCLYLALGSRFYGVPDGLCLDRIHTFAQNFKHADALIISQEEPPQAGAAPVSRGKDPYATPLYRKFVDTYLRALCAHAGIENARTCKDFRWKAKSDGGMHYFEMTTTRDMVCTAAAYDGLTIEGGTVFKMFKTWKRDTGNVFEITLNADVNIETLGHADKMGTNLYLIHP